MFARGKRNLGFEVANFDPLWYKQSKLIIHRAQHIYYLLMKEQLKKVYKMN
jgi:hypothetical protein